MARGSDVVPRRDPLHRRDLQERREGDVRQRRGARRIPKGLFNSSLDGNVRRAIDFHEGEKINATAFKALVRAAVTLNQSKAKR